MKSFELYDATSVDEAVALLAEHGPNAQVVAGGSDLVGGIMKDWVHGPGMPLVDTLIDITTIPELHGISANGGGATIGSMTTLTDIVLSPELQASYPSLADSALSVASPLIRNFGTLGGNINQRPRCWFFRGEQFTCYKNGGDFCYAVTGDNRFHAIIGGELCYIVHPSDTATALLALGATTTVAGPDGTREMSFDDYFVGPRVDVLRETVLAQNELMVDVKLPSLGADNKQAWLKLKDRQVYDFAVVSVAVSATITDGIWQDGRIVLGGVAPVPWRATVVEDALVGKDVDSAIGSAAALIRGEARPLSNNVHKVDIAIGMTERAVRAAIAG